MAHQNSLKYKKTRDFLKDQGSMIGVEKVLAAKEYKKMLRNVKEVQRRKDLEKPCPSVYQRV